MPIPLVNVHPGPGDGSHVDFTTINTTTATRLADEGSCSLCGQPMQYWGEPSWVGRAPLS